MPEGAEVARLDTALRTSKYVDFAHLVVTLDGQPLDEWVAARTGDTEYEGLITTLEDCMIDMTARPVAWERILPAVGSNTVAPILVCESDLDFSCVVVVVEVARPDEHRVQWARFGRDQSKRRWEDPGRVGSNVDWFEGFELLTFDAADYRSFIDDCRRLKTEWWSAIPETDRGRVDGVDE